MGRDGGRREGLLFMPVGAARVAEHFMRDLIDSGGAFPLDGGRIMDGNGEWIGEGASEMGVPRQQRIYLRSG